MKINPVNSLVAVLLGALLAYALWSMGGSIQNYIAVGSSVFFIGTLLPLIGGTYEHPRRAVNLRVVCGVFFALGIVINVLAALLDLSPTAYIIISALAFLIYVLIANAIYNAK